MKPFTHIYDEKVKALYAAGLSTGKIAKIFNVSREAIRYRLHKLGTNVRSQKEACTKYTLDKTFFNNINTEEKAYWLGFLTADGGIVGHQLVLSLKMADKEHIEKFRTAIKSNHPIKTVISKINNKNIPQPRLVISSMPIIRALKTLGVGEKKSLTVKPAILPKQFHMPYWRGIFDGDGHINISQKSRVMELTGNQYILTEFKKFLKQKINIISKLTKDKSVYRVRHGKRSSVFEIAKLLYSSSTIHLKRKYEVAKTIFSDEFFCLRKNSSEESSRLSHRQWVHHDIH